MKIIFNKSVIKNELVVNGIVSHEAEPAVIVHAYVSKEYKRFKKS